jgi:ribose/xylose/arabinose/galactoside ABC-type transport system permease subunit
MNRLATQLLQRTPWIVSGVILLTLVLAVPAFYQPLFWLSLARQYFAPAMLALALTPIILTGGIDLSVGSVTVFTSVVIGVLWRDLGLPIECALLGGVLAGLLAGLGNGLLVTVGVLPLVATLATRELFRGLAWTLSGNAPVNRFPPELSGWWGANMLGVPLPLLVIAGLFVLTYLVVHHTWVGRMLFAIGDNERAARFAGVPVTRLKLGLYAASGFVAGLCGAAMVLKYGAAKADAEKSLELIAIACVVLGGIRITGGGGHVAGTLLGIITVASLLAGLGSVASSWRDTITGSILVAVAITNEAAARWATSRGSGSTRPIH